MMLINPWNEDHYYYHAIPDHDMEIRFSTLKRAVPPEELEEEYHILICVGEPDQEHYRIFHRISLLEPKYLYGRDRLSDEYRDAVIEAINAYYKAGLRAINLEEGSEVFDINKPIPDYTLL